MENLYGKKGWIQPLAVASSEGPSGSVNRPTENTINSQATRASSSGSSFREDGFFLYLVIHVFFNFHFLIFYY